MKLHLGCGMDIREGWVNIDGYCVDENIINYDLSTGLPAYADNSIDFIFSQHFVEHITRNEAFILFEDCYKKLKPGGVMRVVVPDLKECVRRYIKNDIDFGEGGYSPLSRCKMMNDAFYEWGHKAMYDKDDLMEVLCDAGFSKIEFPDWGESTYKELSDMDTRLLSDLRVEVVK